jgi:hypothetical protein
MWTIAKIEEADYGCEERLPGAPYAFVMEARFFENICRCRRLSGSAYR